MRFADTETLIRLNDRAVLNDFNEWLAATFFDDVKEDGVHLQAVAIRHGVRPGSRITTPAHYRTLWYAEMADGSTACVRLDVEDADLISLPRVPGADEHVLEEGIPAIVVLSDGTLVDGKHVAEAGRAAGLKKLEAMTIPRLSDHEVAKLRNAATE